MQRSPPPVPRPASRPYIARLQPPKGRTVVIGAGKASAAMARAVEDQWPHPLEGLVVTRYGYGESLQEDRDRRGGASGARREGPRRRAVASSTR